MRILITGGNGYIARSLYSFLSQTHSVTKVSRADFDLSSSKETTKWFVGKEFDVVINTAIIGGSRLYSDDSSVLEKNLLMHYNLHSCKSAFSRLIGFGSGAEVFAADTPYGMSKKIIANSIAETDNWYNIRIFAVFNQDELPTRFIKANILRYINNQSLLIHKNKVMDFFYMDDLSELVKFYLEEKTPPKESNCSYDKKHTLLDIAKMINNLNAQKVSIEVEQRGNLDFYCGVCNLPNIPLVGLEHGIRKTFEFLSA